MNIYLQHQKIHLDDSKNRKVILQVIEDTMA